MLEILVENLASAVVAAADDRKIFTTLQPGVTVLGPIRRNLMWVFSYLRRRNPMRVCVPKNPECDADFRS
jgi:hypothetical protein